jgi:hypothetical protein
MQLDYSFKMLRMASKPNGFLSIEVDYLDDGVIGVGYTIAEDKLGEMPPLYETGMISLDLKKPPAAEWRQHLSSKRIFEERYYETPEALDDLADPEKSRIFKTRNKLLIEMNIIIEKTRVHFRHVKVLYRNHHSGFDILEHNLIKAGRLHFSQYPNFEVINLESLIQGFFQGYGGEDADNIDRVVNREIIPSLKKTYVSRPHSEVISKTNVMRYAILSRSFK